jgi:hypothetical protein
MSESQIELNINEENQISFALNIDGSTTEMNVSPVVRFCLCGDSDMSFSFNMEKDSENDEVFVVIPPMDKFLHDYEDKVYTGKLEVIIGSRYFVPSTFDIVFKKPLKVEVRTVRKGDAHKMLESSSVEPKVKAKVVQRHSSGKHAPVSSIEKTNNNTVKPTLHETLKGQLTEQQIKRLKMFGKQFGKTSLREEYEAKSK